MYSSDRDTQDTRGDVKINAAIRESKHILKCWVISPKVTYQLMVEK
jgi:hypothetical protein